MESMLFFDLINLFAECRLREVQPVGGASEIQLLGQDIDCPQVTHFDPREHSSNSLHQVAEIGYCPTSSQGTRSGEKYQERIIFANGRNEPMDKENA
jgi:hypothetical protein